MEGKQMTDTEKYKSVAIKINAYHKANSVKEQIPELKHLSIGGLMLFLTDKFEQDVNSGKYKQTS